MLELIATAQVRPADPALYDGALKRWWTHEQLADTVRSLARLLEAPQRALVFSFCRSDIASIAWYLASLEGGHAVALLDEGLAGEFKQRLISTYAPDFVISARPATDFGAADPRTLGYEPMPTGQQGWAWRRTAAPGPALHPRLAVLLATSGSTGNPRFVRLTLDNLLANAKSICQALDIQAHDRAISSLPMQYSYGLSVLNTHLLAGASVVVTEEGLTTPAFWQLFRDLRCHSFAGVPYSYQILSRLDLNKLAGPSLRVMTQAGGKLHDGLIARFHQLMADRGGARFYVMYGQTEATARISVLPWDRLPEKLGSVGLAIPGGTLALQAADGAASAGRESGELVYTGPNVMMGYAASRDDLRLGDVLGGRLVTGDAAHFDADGFLFIDGRLKRDAKIFGLRINLDDIEAMLRVHGPTAVVAGSGKIVVFCEYGVDADYQRYRHELEAKLTVHHGAFQFVRLARIPTTSSGKIDYPALQARL